jgi:hypothetical protein
MVPPRKIPVPACKTALSGWDFQWRRCPDLIDRETTSFIFLLRTVASFKFYSLGVYSHNAPRTTDRFIVYNKLETSQVCDICTSFSATIVAIWADKPGLDGDPLAKSPTCSPCRFLLLVVGPAMSSLQLSWVKWIHTSWTGPVTILGDGVQYWYLLDDPVLGRGTTYELEHWWMQSGHYCQWCWLVGRALHIATYKVRVATQLLMMPTVDSHCLRWSVMFHTLTLYTLAACIFTGSIIGSRLGSAEQGPSAAHWSWLWSTVDAHWDTVDRACICILF